MTTQEHHSSVWDAVIFRGRTTEILCCAVRALTWLSREVHMHAGPFLFTVLEQPSRTTRNRADTPVCFVALYQQSPKHVICSSHLPVQQVLHAKCQGSALCVLLERHPTCDLTSETLIARAV